VRPLVTAAVPSDGAELADVPLMLGASPLTGPASVPLGTATPGSVPLAGAGVGVGVGIGESVGKGASDDGGTVAGGAAGCVVVDVLGDGEPEACGDCAG